MNQLFRQTSTPPRFRLAIGPMARCYRINSDFEQTPDSCPTNSRRKPRAMTRRDRGPRFASQDTAWRYASKCYTSGHLHPNRGARWDRNDDKPQPLLVPAYFTCPVANGDSKFRGSRVNRAVFESLRRQPSWLSSGLGSAFPRRPRPRDAWSSDSCEAGSESTSESPWSESPRSTVTGTGFN